MGRLLTLQDLVQTVTVTLENVSDTLADMHLYPLDVEVVVEDVKKLQVWNWVLSLLKFEMLSAYQPTF